MVSSFLALLSRCFSRNYFDIFEIKFETAIAFTLGILLPGH